MPIKCYVAVIRSDEACHDIEARCLAGTIGPQETDDLAAMNDQADIAQHRSAGIAFSDTINVEAFALLRLGRSGFDTVRHAFSLSDDFAWGNRLVHMRHTLKPIIAAPH